MFSIAPIFGHDGQHSKLSPSQQAESSQLAHKHGPSVTAPKNVPAAKKSKAQGKVQRKLSVFMNVKTDAIVNTLQIILYIIKYILMLLLQINHNPEDSEAESKKVDPEQCSCIMSRNPAKLSQVEKCDIVVQWMAASNLQASRGEKGTCT